MRSSPARQPLPTATELAHAPELAILIALVGRDPHQVLTHPTLLETLGIPGRDPAVLRSAHNPPFQKDLILRGDPVALVAHEPQLLGLALAILLELGIELLLAGEPLTLV